jgi:Mrp family chromosome partitioning ATPase
MLTLLTSIRIRLALVPADMHKSVGVVDLDSLGAKRDELLNVEEIWTYLEARVIG